MLNQTLEYCKKRKDLDEKFDWEIIIVDDCSKDETKKIALSFIKKESTDCIRLLQLKKNKGKGGAIRRVFFSFFLFSFFIYQK